MSEGLRVFYLSEGEKQSRWLSVRLQDLRDGDIFVQIRPDTGEIIHHSLLRAKGNPNCFTIARRGEDWSVPIELVEGPLPKVINISTRDGFPDYAVDEGK